MMSSVIERTLLQKVYENLRKRNVQMFSLFNKNGNHKEVTLKEEYLMGHIFLCTFKQT